MAEAAFLDTNVLLYAAGTDPRSGRARAIIRERGVISVQVLNEFANVALRKLKRSLPDVRQALEVFQTILGPALPVTEEDHALALDLVEDHGIAFYDAVIVATALRAGCATLVSEDMQDGMLFRKRLRVSNPFRVA